MSQLISLFRDRTIRYLPLKKGILGVTRPCGKLWPWRADRKKQQVELVEAHGSDPIRWHHEVHVLRETNRGEAKSWRRHLWLVPSAVRLARSSENTRRAAARVAHAEAARPIELRPGSRSGRGEKGRASVIHDLRRRLSILRSRLP